MINDSSTPQPTGTNPAGIPVYTFGGLEFARVPKGKFIMGSEVDKGWIVGDERPQHEVDIPYDYWIGRFPVTNAQYNEFLRAVGAKHPVYGWSKERDDHPVVYVSWGSAMSYCMWLNELHGSELLEGYQFRLPTEAEWEKAARGQNGNEWPWGNIFDPTRSNCFDPTCANCDGASKTTTPIGKYSPRGDSPYGATDMAGNVWEWCHSLYEPYPYRADDGREDETASGSRVLRGGYFDYDRGGVRGAYRQKNEPGKIRFNIGFRVAASPISPVK